ncbi:MAG TPA: efflux RND transporter periplasmic adaptor subunit, partial [Polyangiaceae bacterium]|nr:efflux RND transporter periplasmic adaptor subunit [Polyangiaceae bacterium]
ASPGAGGPGAAAAARAVPVVTGRVVARDVPIYLDGLGNAVPISTVTVRSQVDGRLDRVLFKEGQTVHAHDVIAEIDPRPFQILLHQGEAALARDNAQLENARATLARDQNLTKDSLITQQQLDDQQALVRQYEANLAGDRAQIENARLQLDYAAVRAPSDGVTGIRLVDPGNLVHATDPAGLVVITQLDPMSVVFALPQDDLARVNQALAHGELTVQVSSRDGSQELATGKLALVDNQINQATATAKLKAIVPNQNRQLWPNQFVKVRLQLETRPHALLVAAAAVQRGPEGTFVYVVGEDQTVLVRHVDIAQVEDNQAIIAKGLSEGEQVVTEGQTQLKPGSKVSPRPEEAAPGHGSNGAGKAGSDPTSPPEAESGAQHGRRKKS